MKYTVNFEQEIPTNKTQPEPQAHLIPVTIALFDVNGSAMPLKLDGTQGELTEATLQVKKQNQQFVFTGIDQDPTPSFLRNFSAPVKLNYAYTSEDFVFLMANDTDTFSRWDASQRFATQWLLDAIMSIQTDAKLPGAMQYIDALSLVLQDQSIDAAFKAEMMILPQESYLAEFIQPIDVDAIYQARHTMQKLLAESLEDLLLTTYQQNKVLDDYYYNATDMGKRRLAGICLLYLNMLGKQEYIDLAKHQIEQANNMTDTIAALEAVNDLDHEFRQQAINDFGEKWLNDALVMDKWFSMQARSRRPEVLETIKSLLNHTKFSIKNPNKVRALIGVFSIANPTAFHNKDGSGYSFLADKIIELNEINPQVASRLVKPLIGWKKYDKARQALMKAELKRIKTIPGLSNDVFEIVDRSLSN